MENITFTLSEMQRTLVSINAYLAAFAEEVENNKKKKVDKKKNLSQEEKRNIYTKKKDRTVIVDPEFEMYLDSEQRFFYTEMAKKYPSVCLMEEPLTYKEYEALKKKYGVEVVAGKIEELENYKMSGKYKSTYKTLKNWCRRRNEYNHS